ncbi:type II secretion system F family protein [Cellulomonas endophytica]|uniref:type II secretion system F family protein n=1 Tax=Cellulomonas endophytica TaxID=2494735 RepID=UPI001013B23C|nr:type II secretion system F family protein [Cellulomonas endophytica]
MPKFAYVALAPDGATSKGTHDAPTLAAARMALVQRQLRVTKIEPKKSVLQMELTPPRIKPAELMHLSRQLSAFLRAGIPILEAIRTIGEENASSAVRRVLEAVGEDLRQGLTLSAAVDKHPDDFPDWYRGILRSAELTGKLDTVLDQLSSYIERDVEARRKIKTALTYPSIVFVMALGTIVVLSVFVLPKFEDFFSSLDAELPLATRMLLGATRFLGSWWWLIVAVLAVLALGAFVASRTTGGRHLLHRIQLRIPVVGEAIRYSKIERFTRLLASMVHAGVALPTALGVATSSLKNLVFERRLAGARDAMLRGEGLAQPIAATGLFPGIASQMLRVGEDTGTLDTQLEVAAGYYERELDYKVAKVTSIIEPVVIIVMGGVVGFVAVALVSAMYGIFRTASL